MLTRLLDKYSEIEASTQDTKIQNDKLDILTQIVFDDKLLESLKNEDQRLITFFSEESIFTVVERFCFGLVYDFSFSPDFRQRDQNEIRNILSLKCFQVLTNIPSSFYSDILSASLEFNIICSNLLLHNIKCNIMKICSEIIKNNIKTTSIDFLDTHFFGFFSQVIFKIMKWNFPIFFMPDIYKQKVTEKNVKSDTNNENDIKKITNDQISIQIDNNDVTKIIDELNKIIEKLGLYLRLNITHDQQQSKTFITISEITDFSLPNFKYISNLIISNIHDNYAMQEFLVDILKSYPEALPDGTIIKRLSQIACNDFVNINENSNNKEISCKNAENNSEKLDQPPKSDNESDQFNFDLIFDKLIKSLCNSYDACYTLVDIYRSLPSDSPILYQFLDSYVLNNIIKAASMIFEEGKRSADSFKHTALTVGLIEIVTKLTINNNKLLSSIELPSNLIISEGNVNEVTISFIELYLKKNKSETTETTTPSTKPNIQLKRRQSASQNSFSTNIANLSILQPQSNNLVKINSESKNIDSSKYIIESKLFKLFFTSEKLQDKLITLFFKHNTTTKILSNKSLFQSSSTNCINLYDSSNSFSFPSSTTSNSFRYSGFDSYPRSSSTGNWQTEKSEQSDEQQSFLIALAKVPGLVHGLESAFDRERKTHLRLTPKSKTSDSNITSSFPIFPLEENGNSSLDTILVTTSNESSMITSSSYDNLDGSTSSADLNAPRWTPACKFLALELVKLSNADISIPELDSRKWKSGVTPAIHRFNSILDSNYGYGDSLISRHRSCSMNDKLKISQPFSSNSSNSSFNRTGAFNSSTFSMNNSSSQLDSRINSFENAKFSTNFLKSISEENHIPVIPNNSKNKIGSTKINNHSYENVNDIDLIEPLEIEINSDNFECDNQNKIDDINLETHKNHPHSLILQDNKCFSTLKEKSSSHAPKSPDFSRYPKPMLDLSKENSNFSSSSDSSSSSSSSICNIKMSTQQTLIQKKKKTKEEEKPSPPFKTFSSSNSEGDDEYIIDI